MRGIIYKDIMAILREIKPIYIIVIFSTIGLTLAKAGVLGGIFATTMVSMALGTISVAAITNDDLARWGKYEVALPVTKTMVVASKYILQLLGMLIAVVSAFTMTLISGLLTNGIDKSLIWIAIVIAVVFPLVWSGIMMPASLYFGSKKGRIAGTLFVIPVFILVKNLEEGIMTISAIEQFKNWLYIFPLIAILFYIISFFISILVYKKREYK